MFKITYLNSHLDKFREKTGWKPTKGLEEICDDLLNYWRKRAGAIDYERF